MICSGEKETSAAPGFLRDLQRSRGRAGQQLGVSVGEKQPGAFGFFRAEIDCVIFSNPAGRNFPRFQQTKARNFGHQAANNFRGFVSGLVIYDEDFARFRVARPAIRYKMR